jgi:hydrogenase-4 component F
MGLLTLGIGFGGPLALLGVTVHAGLHALVKSTLFLSAGELVQRYETRRLSRLRGTLEAAPVAGGTLGVGILLLGGLPPSGIFATEFAIVVGGVMRGYGIAAAVAGLLLALSFVALAVHGSRIVFGRVPSGLEVIRGGFGMAARFGAPLAAVCVLGLWTPGPLATVFDSIRAILGSANG